MLLYQYHSLQYNDSIRLLILHPSSNDSSPIICTIQHARLSDTSLEYEAISYTWGDVTCQQPIYFYNGTRELRVGINCLNVLRHLRLGGCNQQLWIDAICIDQENLIERANQVCIMNKIFHSALGVRVHLGEETPGSCVLFEELVDADKSLLSTGTCNRLPSSDIIAKELDNLFQRPWFRRVWVLQEVQQKRSVTFMCGSAGASWAALRDCLFGYGRGTLITRHPLPLALDLIYDPSPGPSSTQLSLWILLFQSRDCLATDPRDKVFALSSLIRSVQTDMDFLIDYTESVEEIFIKCGLFLLPTLGLRLLTAIRHPHNREMPSWIPDWSQRLPLGFSFFSPDLYETESGSVEPRRWNPPDTDTFFVHLPSRTGSGSLKLNVMGVRYAQITHSSRTFSFNRLEDAEAQMKELYYHLDNLSELISPMVMRDSAISSSQLGREITDGMCIGKVELKQLFLL
jgi:hypothetical protein